MKHEHIWKETTEEGEKREVRAHKEGGKWRVQAKLNSEEAWTYYKRPEIRDLEALVEILERKYRRKRVAFDDITLAKRMIQELS